MSRPLVAVGLCTTVLVGGTPALAGAQQPTPAPTITAIGTATARPDPADRRSNESIRVAVRAAQTEVVPASIAAARRRAQGLAAAAGVSLGALQTISDVPASPFGPFGSFGEDGTFGPGRYCGTVSRFRTRRLASGRVRRVRIGTRRVCRVPSRVTGTVSLTYAVTPAA